MLKPGRHMWICAGMVALAAIVLLVLGSGLALLPLLGCVLMMVVMMQMMRGTGGGT